MGVQSRGWEDPLEEDMATQFHGQRSPAGHSPWGRTRVGQDSVHAQQSVDVTSKGGTGAPQ